MLHSIVIIVLFLGVASFVFRLGEIYFQYFVFCSQIYRAINIVKLL